MSLESISSIGLYGTSGTVQNDNTKVRPEDLKNKIIIRDQKSGKILIMTYEQYIKYLYSLYQQGKEQSHIEPYELGPKKDDTRVIGEESVTEPLKKGSSAPSADKATPAEIREYETNIEQSNGVVDDFKQGCRGDCYLLAAIESIRNTEDGQEILAKNVKVNNDGSYSVVLPGAVAARNNYISQGYDPDKIAITGKYTITKDAIEKAKSLAGKSYAYGDIEVIALELAMEAFRSEIMQTNETLGIKSERFIAGQFAPNSDVDTLSSGFTYDAIFVLTGQKSVLYEAKKEKKKDIKLYIPGEYGYVGEEPKLSKGNVGSSQKGKGIVEIEHLYNKESDLQRMLDTYKGKEAQYSITVSFMVGIDGPDGTTKAGGGHALTVVAITDEYVEVVNPWDTKKHERIPRADFEKMAYRLNVTPMSGEKVDNFYEKNVNNQPEKSNIFNWLFK